MNWRKLHKPDGSLACKEGDFCLFALRVNGGFVDQEWEYFVDQIVWDSDEDSDPHWGEDNSCWPIEDVEYFMPLKSPEAT